ncbi:MAG: replicative DNA helicase [Patescibacteria group bacterium]
MIILLHAMARELTQNLPPSVIDSEKGLLGSILLNKEIMLQVGDILLPDYFYDPYHQVIYALIATLWERQQNVDILVISDRIKNLSIEFREKYAANLDLSRIDKAFLLELTGYASLIGNPVEHAEIIKEKYILRSLVNISDDIKQQALAQKGEVDEILDRAENKIFQLASSNLQQDFVPISDILSSTFDRLSDLHENKGELRGVPTGFSDLDKLLGGFQNSDLIIIAARPGMGKTAFQLSLCVNAALKSKTGVAIFSLEMGRDQLVDRMISMVSGVDLSKIRHGRLEDDPRSNDFMKIGRAISQLAEAPIWIDDSGSLNILELRTKCRRLKARHNVGIVMIDYLQLMSGRSQNASQFNRVQEVSEISRSLKALGRELNIPIIALSQLSRGVESRDDKRPLPSDLRESGSIEQDADVVMFIYRDEVYNKKEDGTAKKPGVAEVIVAKHRNGSTGTVELFFRKERTAFENLEGGRLSHRIIGE